MNENKDVDLTKGDQAINAAFRGSLGDAYYNFVINGEKDMLIDSNNNIVTFETKLITRRFTWNPRNQKWEKMITGVSKTKKRGRAKADADADAVEEKSEEFAE